MDILLIYVWMHKISPPDMIDLNATLFIVFMVLWIGWVETVHTWVFLERWWVWSSKSSLGLGIHTEAFMWQADDGALHWQLSWAVILRTYSSFFMCLWLPSIAIRSQEDGGLVKGN